MALVFRVLGVVLATALRAGVLFAALFFAYLVLDRAWPAYRALSDLAAQRPAIEQEAMRVEGELRRRQARTDQLRTQLEALAAHELLSLRQNVESFEAALRDLDERRAKLESDLAEAVAQEADYCTTWNPIKRWLCKEVQERAARTRGVVEPLLQEMAGARDSILEQISVAGEALRRYEELPLEQRGTTLDAQRTRATLGEQLHELNLERQTLLALEERLAQAKVAEASPWMWLTRQLRAVAWPLSLIVLGVMLLPWVQRVLLYFVVMRWVEHASPVILRPSAHGRLDVGQGKRTLPVMLSQGEQCWARADYVRPVAGQTRSQWLFDWSAPLVSYAAGLSVLTRIEGGVSEGGDLVQATLASPNDSDSYLIEVKLEDHPGFVFHPRHLVAAMGDVRLFTVWRLLSIHAWMTGQLRYIGVCGSGRCVLEGFGDVVAQTVGEAPSRIEQSLLIGFDARLRYSTARTETFLPYFLGRTPLVDDVFGGGGIYVWQKNTRNAPRTVAERTFELLFGAVGKLLGF